MRVLIRWESGQVEALLRDTPTARSVWAALPCDAT